VVMAEVVRGKEEDRVGMMIVEVVEDMEVAEVIMTVMALLVVEAVVVVSTYFNIIPTDAIKH